MKFRFPIVIIDEDFRSENTSGLGIRALAQAIESEGFEVLGASHTRGRSLASCINSALVLLLTGAQCFCC